VTAALLPAAAVVVFAWPHLGDAARGLGEVIGHGARQPPLIKAPEQPIKVAASKGALDQQADAVREMLDGGQAWMADVELLPAVEEPILVPASTSGADPDDGSADPGAPSFATAAVQPPALPEPEPSPAPRLQLEPPPPLVQRGGYTPPDDPAKAGPDRQIRPAIASRDAGSEDVGSEGEVYRIQIAAMPSRSSANQVWETQRVAQEDILGDLHPAIEQVETDTQTLFRVQAGSLPSLTAAQDLCEKLQQRDVACVVVRR
jgi:hypothetical protein